MFTCLLLTVTTKLNLVKTCDFIAGAGSTAETISKKSSNFEPDNNSDVCFIVEGSVEQVGPG